jgi:hypothetical protein
MEEFRQIMHETVISPLFTLFTGGNPQVFQYPPEISSKSKEARQTCATMPRALFRRRRPNPSFSTSMPARRRIGRPVLAAASSSALGGDTDLTTAGVAERS